MSTWRYALLILYKGSILHLGLRHHHDVWGFLIVVFVRGVYGWVSQMCILDGNAYDAKCLEAGQERDEDLDACSLLSNNKMQPLLTPGSAASHNSQSKVIVQLVVSLITEFWMTPWNILYKGTSCGSGSFLAASCRCRPYLWADL